jgi:outer membrane scaffolding protein for murein synthesis (MipA/OmpV family)
MRSACLTYGVSRFLKINSLLALLVFSTVGSRAHAEEAQLIGLGAEYNSAIYQGQDGYTSPYPLINLSYGDFFIDDYVAGWTPFRWNNISVSLVVTQGQNYLDVEDISPQSQELFAGIENRDKAFEAGFIYEYNSPVGIVTWEYFKGVSSDYGGMRNTLRLSRPTGNPMRLTVTPSIYVNYYSTAFNDYYYGISPEENARGRELVAPGLTQEEYDAYRPLFEGQNSGHVGLDVWFKKPYTENLIGVAYLSWEQILGPQNNSSLVEDTERYIFRLGLQYKL